jgi:N-6 DNA Methylase
MADEKPAGRKPRQTRGKGRTRKAGNEAGPDVGPEAESGPEAAPEDETGAVPDAVRKVGPGAGRRGKARERTLTGELAALLARELVPDLAERARQPAVAAALTSLHASESKKKRTAADRDTWVAHTVEQVGAAWILSCLFVRVLEDRGLVDADRRRITGQSAENAQHLFFEIAPSLTERDYLLAVFRELAECPGLEDVFGPRHNPAWRLSPSNDAVRALLALLRQTGPDGTLRHRFEGTDTRFLGDLYQDLSESVRERYALLQTPAFVERFILDQTLDPAIEAFGLDRVRVLDPTCGSGHFLLGAFERLVDRRMHAQPGVDRREHARDALAQVYGVDVNPYAVAIARFRLTLAYLRVAEIDKLSRAPRIETNLVVADSLLHETGQGRLSDVHGDDLETWGDLMFALDDRPAAKRILGQRYHVVVGNPPYITCKDAVLREEYRAAYDSAAGKYALAAPFTERFFKLAEERGFVGMINANSFMKREFGKALIEKVLPQWELTRVVDTSGAYIPGHGTPTVLLFGRRQTGVLATVRAVLGKRGEPGTPEDAEQGHVWSSIAGHFDEPGFENEYISVADMPRETFKKHPWSLGGGGAAELKESLEQRSKQRLGEVAESIGITAFTLEDDVYLGPRDAFLRSRVEPEYLRPMVIGEAIRDWSVSETPTALFPYTADFAPDIPASADILEFLWPCRTNLANNLLFGGKTKVQGKLRWYEYGRLTSDKLRTPRSIAFAFVATHNHFALDRGGKVFNRSAPIIKLPDSATEDDHLSLLAYLNSSTACFWMKQVLFQKSSQNYVGDVKDKPERIHYEFAATALKKLPIPSGSPKMITLAHQLETLAEERTGNLPGAVLANSNFGSQADLESLLRAAKVRYEQIQQQMVVLQEEIDWAVYAAFGLASDALSAEAQGVSLGRLSVRPEQRPCFGVDEDVPPELLPLWRRRRDAIERNPSLREIEQPLYKRPWLGTQGVFHRDEWTFDDLIKVAIEQELLVILEQAISSQPAAGVPLSGLLRLLHNRKRFEILLATRYGGDVSEMGSEIEKLVMRESVPYLAQFRHTVSGLDKFRAWQNVWELQRAEDREGKSLDIPVPLKYAQTDFQDAGYWRLRGKLDVPRERFISYPGAEGDDDRSPLVGWAGWDHLQRAQALAALLQQRKDHDGWEPERLKPLLAGLDELVPWLKQWHDDPDPAYDNQRMGELFEDFVRAQARSIGVTLDELRDWRPERKQGRRGAAAKPARNTKTTSKRAGKSATADEEA